MFENEDRLAWVTIRGQVNEKNMRTHCDTFKDALSKQGINYTDIANIELDSVNGENYKIFLKRGKVWVRRLNKILPAKAKVINDNFTLHLGFMDAYNGNRFKYYPMVLDLTDGQILVGLARQYGEHEDDQKIYRQEPVKITRWFLNGEDITKVVYKTRADIKDELKAIKNIATLIKGNHANFVKENPDVDTKISNEALEKEVAELEAKKEELLSQIEAKENSLNEENIAEEAKAKADARVAKVAKAKAELKERAKAEAEALAKEKAEAEAKAEALAKEEEKKAKEAQAQAEALAKEKADMEAKEKAEKAEAEAIIKAELEAKEKAEREAKTKAEATLDIQNKVNEALQKALEITDIAKMAEMRPHGEVIQKAYDDKAFAGAEDIYTQLNAHLESLMQSAVK